MVVLVNFPAPTEGIHHAEPNVTAYFKSKNLGKGTLYIAESCLCWKSNSGEGFTLEYPSIYIHAVSRDLNNFPEECLYLMIDGKISIGEEEPSSEELSSTLNTLSFESDEASEDEEEEEEPSVTMRFVPDNRNMLDVMFRALTDCQALNPDPEDKTDDEDGGVVIAPPFTIHEGNGIENPEYEEGEGEDEEAMNEDQFEDAEQ